MSRTDTIIEELREEIRALRARVEALERFPADLAAAFSNINHELPVAAHDLPASRDKVEASPERLTAGSGPRAAWPATIRPTTGD